MNDMVRTGRMIVEEFVLRTGIQLPDDRIDGIVRRLVHEIEEGAAAVGRLGRSGESRAMAPMDDEEYDRALEAFEAMLREIHEGDDTDEPRNGRS